MNRFKILYSSEIDGIKEAQEKIGNLDLNDLTYVEIKLWNGWEDHRKYFQWWSQCRLANVEHLILGEYTKDEAGAQVNRLVEKNVQDFPNMKFGRKDCKVINDFFSFPGNFYFSLSSSFFYCEINMKLYSTIDSPRNSTVRNVALSSVVHEDSDKIETAHS